MPTYNEVVAPILMLPQLAPYLASHLLLPPWPILLEQAQYLASEPAVFYSQREGAMGIISERFAIELQRAPLDGAALFCSSLPSKGSEFFRHRTYTNPLQDISCYHEVPCKICSSPAQQTQVLNELCFAASQGTCLATFQCVNNCCPHWSDFES